MSIPYAVWLPNRNLVVRSVTALSWFLACGCSDASYRLGGDQQKSTNGARSTGDQQKSTNGARSIGLCANGAELESIDQMEDGDGTIDVTAQRGGVWFSFNDETGGTQLPSSDDEVFSMSALEPPRSNSHFAARSQGGGFTKWGAGIGFELYNQKAYDLSRYAGITFWARRAPNTASALRFAVTDSATAPRGGQCQTYADYSTCSDYFGNDLSLGTAFRRYSFRWDELTQEGWGEPHPASVKASEIYGIRFQTDPVEDFDFWIDDVALLCHPD